MWYLRHFYSFKKIFKTFLGSLQFHHLINTSISRDQAYYIYIYGAHISSELDRVPLTGFRKTRHKKGTVYSLSKKRGQHTGN